MNVSLSFHVRGEPQSKARPRFNRATGKPYTPPDTRQYEATIKAHALAAAKRVGWTPVEGETYGVSVRLRFGTRRRRDVDNCVKAVLDAMNSVVWVDDWQVARIESWRVLAHPSPGVLVTVSRCEEPRE